MSLRLVLPFLSAKYPALYFVDNTKKVAIPECPILSQVVSDNMPNLT